MSVPTFGRVVTMTAYAGSGERLASLLGAVADGMVDAPGCSLYVVGRAASTPDVVTVMELWADEEAPAAALRTEAARAGIPEVLALVDGPPSAVTFVPSAGLWGTAAGD